MEEQFIARLSNSPIPRDIRTNKPSRKELKSIGLTIDDTVVQVEDMEIFAFFKDKSYARGVARGLEYHKPVMLWIYIPLGDGAYSIERTKEAYTFLDVYIT